jgi:hypothetical protein
MTEVLGIDCKGTGGGDMDVFGSNEDVASVEVVESFGVLLLPPVYSLSADPAILAPSDMNVCIFGSIRSRFPQPIDEASASRVLCMRRSRFTDDCGHE